MTNADLDEIWITDSELCARWHCTKMSLWRYRDCGLLSPGTKFGNRNLTRLSEIKKIEADREAAARSEWEERHAIAAA